MKSCLQPIGHRNGGDAFLLCRASWGSKSLYSSARYHPNAERALVRRPFKPALPSAGILSHVEHTVRL